MHHHLGKIFISHSTTDKPFVRRLASRLVKAGFQIWLDERDLVVGDPLPEKISEALSSARVVLVVVSRSSIASKWLAYELNIATDRMVKGSCRVIPIVIDDAPLPPEVRGLLYADCRDSLRAGLPAILTALQYESRRAAFEKRFWARADLLVEEVFGGRSYVSLGGEYHSRDYETVELPIEDENGNSTTAVFYEAISNYLGEPQPLTENWFADYVRTTDDYPETLSLVVTERPIGFAVECHHTITERVSIRRVRDHTGDFLYRQVVIADLSGLMDEAEQKRILSAARESLIKCVEYDNRYREKSRQKYQ